jgi:uncharacterized DUF497 family protein
MDYSPTADFEWDQAKSAWCARVRGFDFRFATRAFSDPNRRVVQDTRDRYDETRFRLFGRIDGRLHVIVFTHRAEVIRIISARKANQREIRFHADGANEDRHL